MEAYQVEGDVGEGISRILQEDIEKEEKQADAPWMKQERSVYEKMKWGKLSFDGKLGDALVFN